MTKKVKLVIDSVFEGLIRIKTTTDNEKKTASIDIQALRTILKEAKIDERKSYLVTFENIRDYNRLTSGRIGKNFKPKGKIEVVDTTKEDLKAIRKLQRRLGLRG